MDVPKGFVLVDVVLPAHRAFIARKWAVEAKAKIKAAEAAELYAKEEAAGGFRPGARCEVVSVHHHVFKKEIGKKVIITKVSHDTRQVWAHDDRPARYRTNRNGRRVTEYDPRCVESCYSFDQLRILSYQEKTSHDRSKYQAGMPAPGGALAATYRGGNPEVLRVAGLTGGAAAKALGLGARATTVRRWIGKKLRSPMPRGRCYASSRGWASSGKRFERQGKNLAAKLNLNYADITKKFS